MTEIELFKPIPGFDPRYQAGNLGNLKTLNWKNTGREAIMKPAIASDGYLRTMLLGADGKYHTVRVHIMIGITWHGAKPFPKAEINHKDTNKLNNRADNLEWCTRKQNMKHAYDNGLIKTWKGGEHPKAQLNEQQVMEIRARFKKRVVTRKILANEYGVSEDIIKSIIIRRTWKHL